VIAPVRGSRALGAPADPTPDAATTEEGRAGGEGDGPRHAPGRRGPAARALVAAVRAYQLARGQRPSPCRYWPTCSAYAIEAIERHGAARGSWLAVRRLARCHPWAPYGADPVPE
jgi:putative membrane protein insertion efficiency factor